MWTDFFAGVLGGFGGVGLGFLLVKWLGSKFIETQLAKAIANHQHELDKQLATLQDGMSRLGDVASRRNEREFAVTEKAWELMIEAVGSAQYELAGNFPNLIFRGKSEAEVGEAIDSLTFTPTQKAALRAAEPRERERLHFELSREHGHRRVFETWGDLHRWLTARQIFLTPPTRRSKRLWITFMRQSPPCQGSSMIANPTTTCAY